MIFHPVQDQVYYVVIFTSTRSDDLSGYHAMAENMFELAKEQEGYLGLDSSSDDSIGITISYWENEESIKHWKQVVAHKAAQQVGRDRWYADYHLHVAKVERNYSKKNSDFV